MNARWEQDLVSSPHVCGVHTCAQPASRPRHGVLPASKEECVGRYSFLMQSPADVAVWTLLPIPTEGWDWPKPFSKSSIKHFFPVVVMSPFRRLTVTVCGIASSNVRIVHHFIADCKHENRRKMAMNGPNSCSILYILQPWGTSPTATDTNKTKQAHLTMWLHAQSCGHRHQ